jgi:hypothetical protein
VSNRRGRGSVEDFRGEDFMIPNLWQNYIGEKARVLAAFVPVDEAHTILYLVFTRDLCRHRCCEKW